MAPDGCEPAPLASLGAVLAAVSDGEAAYAVAALDSAAGPIAETHAALDSGCLEVIGRHTIRVSFDLYRKPGDSAPLAGVYGHEKALAQCAHWITAQSLKTRALASNTAGLAAVRDGVADAWGAIGPPGLAKAYGLAVCGQALEAPARNETAFVLLRRTSDAE